MAISTNNARPRIESVDVLRGVIMIIMALDHTRDYFGDAAASPTNLQTASAALFFTRWITNFCAPVFFLLTGTGAYLALRRRTPGQLSRYLLTRGVWLIFLELTFARFIWQFNVDYGTTVLTVLWALGWSMIVLSALVHLPAYAVTTFGVILIACHNLFDGVTPASFGILAPLWTVLHSPGFLVPGAHSIFIAYPLVPWIGVTAVGYSLARIFDWPGEIRRQFLTRVGVSLTVGFLVIRFINVYGDPRPWSPQQSSFFTFLSFLNTNKYPPSLLFLMMTLGPALLLLRAVDTRTPRVLRPALTIGKVPFFYYLGHALLLHVMAVIACVVRFGVASPMFTSPTVDKYPVSQPPGWPAPLPVVYLIWISVVIIIYPACRWYAGLKQRRRDPWLSYL